MFDSPWDVIVLDGMLDASPVCAKVKLYLLSYFSNATIPQRLRKTRKHQEFLFICMRINSQPHLWKVPHRWVFKFYVNSF